MTKKFIRYVLSGVAKVQGRDIVNIKHFSAGLETTFGKRNLPHEHLRQARNMEMSIVLIFWWQSMFSLVYVKV